MNKCARCNKKRNLLERWFSFDKEFCDECLFDIDEEIREKIVLPTRRQKDDGEGKP